MPKIGAAPTKLPLPNDCPNVGVVPKPNCAVPPGVPKPGLRDAPTMEVLDNPMIELLDHVPDPNVGAPETAKSMPVLPNVELDDEPIAEILVAPQGDVLCAPKVRTLAAAGEFSVDAVEVEEPNRPLPKVACVH